MSGKKRSKSNRIGTKGENIFASWAVDRLLSPNKADNDLGIDFLCEHLNFVCGNEEIEESTGGLLAAWVRSTEGNARPRIKMSRADAERFLSVRIPACLFGIDVRSQQVHFAFRDEVMLAELDAFIRSGKKTKSWQLCDLASEIRDFDKLLKVQMREGYQQTLRMKRSAVALRASCGRGATLHTRSSEDGTSLGIQVPWINSAFEVDPKHLKNARKLVFGKGRPLCEMPGAKFKTGIQSSFELADQTVAIKGIFEQSQCLRIYQGDKAIELPVSVRNLDDELAWCHSSGFALACSGKRENSAGGKYHQLSVDIFSDAPMAEDPLMEHVDLISFLCACGPKSDLQIRGDQKVPAGTWAALVELSRVVRAIVAIEKLAEGVCARIRPVDLNDKELLVGVGFLEAIFVRQIEISKLLPGFILDEELSMDDDHPKESARIRLPVVLNIGLSGIAIWFELTGSFVLNQGGQKVGLIPGKGVGVDIEIFDNRLDICSGGPEAWIHPDWPPIPLEYWFREGLVECAIGKKVPFGLEIL
jgi:hypothetical protein